MKNHLLNLTLAANLLLTATGLQAQEPEALIMAIANPAQSNGVHIGDVLHRSITLEVKTPYQLSKTAYPMKGTNRDGMELVDFKAESTSTGQITRYRLDFSYQIFAYSPVPTVMQLPAETLAITGGPKALTLAVQPWHFWFAPLVAADFQTAKANVQPQLKPELIDIGAHQIRALVFAGLLVASLLAAVYINADRRWLPFMGGAFAQAHRRIKRLGGSEGEERKALMYLHQAFNQMHGGNLFAHDLDAFLVRHPGFARMHKEIADFFLRSNKALFASPPNDRSAFIRELVILSKGLRDCERGLR